MRLVIVLLLPLLLSACQDNADQGGGSAGVVDRQGSLETYLKGIQLGQDGMDDWVEPGDARRADFASALQLLLSGDVDQAAAAAANAGYELQRYQDTDLDPARTHYVLAEQHPFGSTGFTGGGTYVYYPDGVPLAIEVPHPLFDTHTDLEGIEQYLQLGARFLLLSGTHRHSSPTATTCSGTTDYRRSDPAHYDQHLFQTVHEVADQTYADLLFLQLHGFGSSSLSALQQATGITSDSAVIVSQGTTADSTTAEQGFAARLAQAVNNSTNVQAVIYPYEYNQLGGTRNVQGRYTNGSSDPCTQAAASHSGRFVHLEQSYTVRDTQRSVITQAIAAALP